MYFISYITVEYQLQADNKLILGLSSLASPFWGVGWGGVGWGWDVVLSYVGLFK